MHRAALLLVVLLLGPPAPLAADRAGVFDHFLLSLSWSPSWCAAEGDAREAEACAPGAGFGWVLHGLWPQHATGWPEWCDTQARDPTRAETAAMADVMGSGGLAWHQWRKHGRCTGLAPEDYFARSRAALDAVVLPEPGPETTAAALGAALTRLNPELPADGFVVTCSDGRVMELRVCLDRDLGFRTCGADVLARACRPERALAAPPPR